MINLAIIYGSRSCEHDVSIITAIQLYKNVNNNKYNPILVYIDKSGDWYTGKGLEDLNVYPNFEKNKTNFKKVALDLHPGSGALIYYEESNKLFSKNKRMVISNIDVAIPVFHGMNGEDGTIQGLLELAGIPYASSGVASCAVGMDKVIMKSVFRANNFRVVDDINCTIEDWQVNKVELILKAENKLNYPMVIKPANLGSSIGISKANNKQELIDAIELAFDFDRKIIIEKAIINPIELNCSVLGDSRAVESSEVEMPITGGDVLGFIDKYLSDNSTKGMAALKRILPAPISEELKLEIQRLSIQIFRALDCRGVVRIDYMYDKESDLLYVNEINSIPGSMSFYLWKESGVSYEQLIDRLVDIAKYAFDQKKALNYSFSSEILKENSGMKFGTKGIK